MNENTKKLLDNLKKNVRGMTVGMMADSTVAIRTGFIKTPSFDLNRILSGDLFHGIPEKTLVGIAGPEHSFKSSFCMLCAADAVKEGYIPVVIDTEGGITKDFCTRWGLNVDDAIYSYEIFLERIIPFIANLKDSGMRKMIIILDSVGGLERMKTYNDALDADIKQDQGQLQRSIRTLMKLLAWVCVETDSICIFTAHMLSRPGSVPMPDDVAGGKAVKLFPSIFINLKKESMKKEEKVVGHRLVATTMKNRFYPPFQTAAIDINYQEGINRSAGLLELLLPDKANLLRKEGNSYFNISDDTKYATYDNAVEAKLLNDMPMMEKLNEWLKTTGYSTVDTNVKEAETLLGAVKEEAVKADVKGKKLKTNAKARLKTRRGFNG